MIVKYCILLVIGTMHFTTYSVCQKCCQLSTEYIGFMKNFKMFMRAHDGPQCIKTTSRLSVLCDC